ncbi:hypothetical protein A2U01_0085307, partial [Trifolium medium]|nr:hypothetical protein [Trifolium medium]
MQGIPNVIRRKIWLQASGPGPKNRKYGFGKLASNIRYDDLLHVPTPEERCRPAVLPPEAHE